MKKLYFFAFSILFSTLWSQSFYNNNASTGDSYQPAIDKDSNVFVYHGNRLEKYDKNLNPVWAKTYSSINFQNLLLSKTGSMYFLKGDSAFGKLNPDGSLAWMKSIKTGTLMSAGYNVTVTPSTGSFQSIFLDRNDDLIMTGLMQVSGYPFPNNLGTTFVKCDTLGNFKKAAFIKTLNMMSGISITGLHDSSGYYNFVYDLGDCNFWPNCNFYWGKLIYSDYVDSVVTRINNGSIGLNITNPYLNVIYKSKNKNVHYRRISYFSGPGNTGLYLFKYVNNCLAWRLSTVHSSSLSISNFDEDANGNCFLTFSKGNGGDGFMRVNPNGITDGSIHQYSYSGPANSTKARVINYNNYFIDGYGIGSNPFLVGKFDTTLNISCTTTLAFGSTTTPGGCGATSTVSSTYSLSPISFNTLSSIANTVSVSVNKNFCLSIGEEVLTDENDFNLYPNPSSGKFVIELNEDHGIKSIEIFDIVGNKLFSTLFKQSKCDIDISRYGKGLYLVKIDSDSKTFFKKIVID